MVTGTVRMVDAVVPAGHRVPLKVAYWATRRLLSSSLTRPALKSGSVSNKASTHSSRSAAPRT